jgi:hypothetical protein
MPTTKTYRASRNIAANHKNCPLCRGRIDVGQPIQFTDGKATHVRCTEFVAIPRADERDAELRWMG